MDLTLRKMVYKGPVVERSVVTRNGRRPVLLPEREGRMYAEYLVQDPHGVGAKNSHRQHV